MVKGRSVINAVSPGAQKLNIYPGMSSADAKAIYPGLQIKDDEEISSEILLNKFTEWFIRFTPFVSTDPPDGIILDASGCAHLWEEKHHI